MVLDLATSNRSQPLHSPPKWTRLPAALLAAASLACGSSASSKLSDPGPETTITQPASDVTVSPGQSVTFAGTCVDSDGDAVTPVWTFDGAAPDAQTDAPGPVTFGSVGTFVVTLRCTDANGVAAATPATRSITVQQSGHVLSGKITFDKVPSTDHGLDFPNTSQLPVRGAEVVLVDAATRQTQVAAGLTQADGSYSLSWTQDVGQLQLVVYATTDNPKIVVEDNTNNNVPWGMGSPAFDPATTSTLNLNASSGWTGTSYGKPRAAAPFAVLDAAYQAAQAFLSVRPQAVFPALQINWSPNNAPVGPQNGETQDQAYAAGHIGTSHWNGSQLYILGQADVDTDEFDDHVIVHEWGHYFESKLGRSDNPGGSHSAGQIKDPRLAFGEGWGNALSAMVWSPRTEYTDTSGTGEASGFGFDLEDNVSYDPTPGWFSESSVQSVLFDLFDDSGASESYDQVALGLGPIYDVMTGAQKNTPALTTLFSFIDALKTQLPDQAAAIDTLTQYNGVLGAPVADAYGTGETNSGGNSNNLPVYHPLTIGGAAATVYFSAGDFNDLSESRFLHFTGDGTTHSVVISPTCDVTATLFDRGNQLYSGDVLASSTGNLAFNAASGDEIVIVLTGYTTTSAQASVSVQ